MRQKKVGEHTTAIHFLIIISQYNTSKVQIWKINVATHNHTYTHIHTYVPKKAEMHKRKSIESATWCKFACLAQTRVAKMKLKINRAHANTKILTWNWQKQDGQGGGDYKSLGTSPGRPNPSGELDHGSGELRNWRPRPVGLLVEIFLVGEQHHSTRHK